MSTVILATMALATRLALALLATFSFVPGVLGSPPVLTLQAGYPPDLWAGIDEELVEQRISEIVDLGLIRPGLPLKVANPIYREVIPRQLTLGVEPRIIQDPAWYVGEDGRLDVEKLLEAFRDFFREHSEHWIERFDYKEAGPQLLMQAFLHRVVNSGGRVEREYGLGLMRTDLLLIWPHPRGVQKAVLELKLLHKSRQRTIEEGLEQTRLYMDRCGAEEGHLVIFDRSAGKSWKERIFREKRESAGQAIQVWGM
ncbi:MAG: hypothetical protein V3T83_09265 [Acidobacteriota bacterium]